MALRSTFDVPKAPGGKGGGMCASAALGVVVVACVSDCTVQVHRLTDGAVLHKWGGKGGKAGQLGFKGGCGGVCFSHSTTPATGTHECVEA